MNIRPMVLRNREVNPIDENSDRKIFSGVTTRKRAALKALENANISNKDSNELKNITNRLKPVPLIEETEQEPMDISIKKIETELIDYDYLVKNPLIWPKYSEIDTKESRKSLLKTIIERRNSIRSHFSDSVEHGLPIWMLSRFDNHDEFMNIEYLTNINDYLIDNELESEILGQKFLENGSSIGPRQRYVFVDWLVQAHSQFAMGGEVLQLAIAIFDRFVKVHKTSLKMEDMMVVGLICILMASKVEEVWPPSLADLISHFKLDYSMEFCRQLEAKIVSTIDFRLSIPLPISFIRHYNIVIEGSPLSNYLSRYFCELSLQDYEASGHSVNLIGASCVYLAQIVCRDTESDFEQVWCQRLQASSGLLYIDIKPLVRNLCVIVSKQQTASHYRAITSKYASERFMNAPTTCITSKGFRSILSFFKSEMNKQIN